MPSHRITTQERDRMREMARLGHADSEIAEELDRSLPTVRHWVEGYRATDAPAQVPAKSEREIHWDPALADPPKNFGGFQSALARAARQHTFEGLDRLVELMRQDDDKKTALEAVKLVHNRGWGSTDKVLQGGDERQINSIEDLGANELQALAQEAEQRWGRDALEQRKDALQGALTGNDNPTRLFTQPPTPVAEQGPGTQGDS